MQKQRQKDVQHQVGCRVLLACNMSGMHIPSWDMPNHKLPQCVSQHPADAGPMLPSMLLLLLLLSHSPSPSVGTAR
jgi:hypothetical protein